MLLHIASDLHQHRDRGAEPDLRIAPVNADVLVLAGDIDYVEKVSLRYSTWPHDVLYVRGNHDLYHRPYERAIAMAVSQMTSGRVRMLERSTVLFPRVRVLGCCLWTDFELVGDLDDVLLLNGEEGADYRFLRRTDGRRMTPNDVRAEHRASVEWLRRELGKPFEGKTIVVSHHAPHRRSLDPSYGVNWASAAFASDLSHMMRKVALWIHGHIHFTADYKVRGCRVVCNPAGSLSRPNPAFEPDFVIEV